MIDPDLEGAVKKFLMQVMPEELITEEMIQERVAFWAPLKEPPTGKLEVEFMESLNHDGVQIPVCATTVEFGPACCLGDMAKTPSTITYKFGVIETLN